MGRYTEKCRGGNTGNSRRLLPELWEGLCPFPFQNRFHRLHSLNLHHQGVSHPGCPISFPFSPLCLPNHRRPRSLPPFLHLLKVIVLMVRLIS